MSLNTNLTSDVSQEADPRFFQAVQYVLGELSVTDQAAFEAALIDDVTLCELVAEATCLTQGVKLALATPAPGVAVTVRRDRWLVAAVVTLATGIAAGLLATVSAPQAPDQTARLVSLWRDAGRTNTATSFSASSLEADDSVDANEDRVPNWMLAAVSLEHRPSRASLPGDTPPEPWEDN